MYKERVYSEFEVTKVGIQFDKDEKSTVFGCTGSMTETMEQIKRTKKCEGVIAKTTTKGTGNGTIKLSIHAKYDLLCKAIGMDRENLKEGVKAYGKNSIHEEFKLTCEVHDEDNLNKLKAYPKCIITNKPEITITNGEEEVGETELEIAVMPDEHGEGVYEAICDTGYLEDETIIESWLSNFTYELVKKEGNDIA